MAFIMSDCVKKHVCINESSSIELIQFFRDGSVTYTGQWISEQYLHITHMYHPINVPYLCAYTHLRSCTRVARARVCVCTLLLLGVKISSPLRAGLEAPEWWNVEAFEIAMVTQRTQHVLHMYVMLNILPTLLLLSLNLKNIGGYKRA